MMMILAALLALVSGGPGSEKLFGDWAVTCDNVKRCEATAMMPEDWTGDQAPGLDISREPGAAGAVTIALLPNAETCGIVDILIDKKLMSSGPIRDGAVTLTGASAEGLARAMVTGRQVTLRAHGKMLGTISLKGASAAMRYMDAEQGRVGGVTALVARGPKGAAAVPAAAALPRVRAVLPGRGKAAALSPAQIAPLRQAAGCSDYHVSEDMKPELHRLDGRSTLVLIPCIMGAYQGSYAIFVATDARIVPAPFDFFPEDGSERTPAPWLVFPAWDPAQAELISRAKGRGPADCGITMRWVWDGSRFRMTSYKGLQPCRLSGNWLTRYRAEAAYK